MNTNGLFQSSEEEKLKMFNSCCCQSDELNSQLADLFVSVMLIERIKQLEDELSKNGIDIPKWGAFENYK